jgi:hypothetical protein
MFVEEESDDYFLSHSVVVGAAQNAPSFVAPPSVTLAGLLPSVGVLLLSGHFLGILPDDKFRDCYYDCRLNYGKRKVELNAVRTFASIPQLHPWVQKDTFLPLQRTRSAGSQLYAPSLETTESLCD